MPECTDKPVQMTLEGSIEYIPPCLDKDYEYTVHLKKGPPVVTINPNPVISCFNCSGRIKAKRCDELKDVGRIILTNRNGLTE